MRCLSCNKMLSDSESVRKSATTGLYIDLCNKCFKSVEDLIEVAPSDSSKLVDEYGEDDVEEYNDYSYNTEDHYNDDEDGNEDD